MRGGIILAVLALANGALGAETQSVAILNIAGEAGDTSLRQSVIDGLATQLGAMPGVRVITRSEIDSLLGLEKVKDALGCSDMSCLAEIGGALGSDRLLAGTLAHNPQPGGADFYSLTLQLVDPKAGETRARVTETWEGSAEGLFALLPSLTLKLMSGSEAANYRGLLKVTSPVEGAGVFVDGQQLGLTPLLAPLSLPIGKAKVEIVAEDYEPFRQTVVIDRDRTTGLVATLSEVQSAPLTSRWWFWAGAAAVLAGGAVATYQLTRGDQDPQPQTGSDNFGNSRGSGSVTVPSMPGALQLRSER